MDQIFGENSVTKTGSAAAPATQKRTDAETCAVSVKRVAEQPSSAEILAANK